MKSYFYAKHLFIIIILIIILSAKIIAQPSDTIKWKPHFELSFGQSLLFISNDKLASIRNQSSVILPTNSILFFIEFRPHKTARIPIFFNLPTETKQYLVDGVIINERASHTFGTGVEFKLFQLVIDKKSKLEFEIGPLASFIFNKYNNIKIAPLIAGRVRLMRGENFVMYFGGSYSFGINALGLLYGTGTVF